MHASDFGNNRKRIEQAAILVKAAVELARAVDYEDRHAQLVAAATIVIEKVSGLYRRQYAAAGGKNFDEKVLKLLDRSLELGGFSSIRDFMLLCKIEDQKNVMLAEIAWA